MVSYLKGTTEYGLIYARDHRIFLHIYDDFDWVGNDTNRKITPTCYRNQTSISLSATKDEYIAANNKARNIPQVMRNMIQKNSSDEYEDHTLIRFDIG